MAFKIYLIKKTVSNYSELKKLNISKKEIINGRFIGDDEPETMTIFKIWEYLMTVDYMGIRTKRNTLIENTKLKPHNIAYWFILASGQIYITKSVEKEALREEVILLTKNIHTKEEQVRNYFNELTDILNFSISSPESTLVIDVEY